MLVFLAECECSVNDVLIVFNATLQAGGVLDEVWTRSIPLRGEARAPGYLNFTRLAARHSQVRANPSHATSLSRSELG
mgnify:CR=1 FL=1